MQIMSTTGTNTAFADITNSTNALRLGVEGSGGNMLLPAIAYGSFIASAYSYPLSLGVGGTRYMTINTAGNVGIGTTAPAAPLDFQSASSIGQENLFTMLRPNMPAPGMNYFKIGQSLSTKNAADIYYQHNGVSLDTNSLNFAFYGTGAKLTVQAGGNVGIGITSPSYTLHVVGTAGLSSGTSWTNASDIRLKDVEGDYEYGLAEVKKLHTVRFRYKKDNPLKLPFDQEHTGFIAQEVKELIPDAVITRADGYLELNVDPIHWATVNAVKELALDNDRLKAEAASLRARADKAESESAQLKAESAQLKAAFCTKFPDLALCLD
jgi:hypothetical protein